MFHPPKMFEFTNYKAFFHSVSRSFVPVLNSVGLEQYITWSKQVRKVLILNDWLEFGYYFTFAICCKMFESFMLRIVRT